MPITVKVFMSRNCQAVRLPKAFRVDAREMWVTRDEPTGEIHLMPKPTPDQVRAFIAELRSHPPSEEFVPVRDEALHAGLPARRHR